MGKSDKIVFHTMICQHNTGEDDKVINLTRVQKGITDVIPGAKVSFKGVLFHEVRVRHIIPTPT